MLKAKMKCKRFHEVEHAASALASRERASGTGVDGIGPVAAPASQEPSLDSPAPEVAVEERHGTQMRQGGVASVVYSPMLQRMVGQPGSAAGKRSRGCPNSSAASSSGGSKGGSGGGRLEWARYAEDSPKRRRSRGGTVIDSGRACYDKTVEEWGWGRHWENKGKNREFSNAIKGIQGHGRKCLQHPGNSTAR